MHVIYDLFGKGLNCISNRLLPIYLFSTVLVHTKDNINSELRLSSRLKRKLEVSNDKEHVLRIFLKLTFSSKPKAGPLRVILTCFVEDIIKP